MLLRKIKYLYLFLVSEYNFLSDMYLILQVRQEVGRYVT